MKKLAMVVVLVMMTLMLTACGGSSGGDGKSTCRNCGRDKRLSAMGYCSTCQEGFNDWYDRTYVD